MSQGVPSSQVEMEQLRASMANGYSQMEKNKQDVEDEDEGTVSASYDPLMPDSGRMELLKSRESVLNVEELLTGALEGKMGLANRLQVLLKEENNEGGETLMRENSFWPLLTRAGESGQDAEDVCSLLVTAMDLGAHTGAQLQLRGHAERAASVGTLLATISEPYALALARQLAAAAGEVEAVYILAPILHKLANQGSTESHEYLEDIVRAALVLCRLPNAPPDAPFIREWAMQCVVASNTGANMLALAKDDGVGHHQARKVLLKGIPPHCHASLKKIWNRGLTPDRWHQFEKLLSQ